MFSDSTIYTIGTALNRAHDNALPVEILVEGQWVGGDVVAVDGHGVVIHSQECEHSVIRMGSVSAVRVFSAPPFRPALASAGHAVPGPRLATG